MKGFINILEVFLAITIIYIVLSQVQINLPPKYSDTSNMERLHRYAHDIAFSICGNLIDRRMLLNDTLAFDLASVLPGDVYYHVYIYKNATVPNDRTLDDLAYGYGNPPASPTTTSGCIIAGGPVAYRSEPVSCDYKGTNCLTQISSSNSNWLNVTGDENFTVTFTPSRSGSIVELVVEAMSNQSGNASIVYNFSGSTCGIAHEFNTTEETYVYQLTGCVPDSSGQYRTTIKINGVNASYDYIYMNVSNDTYSPRRVMVQTWNSDS